MSKSALLKSSLAKKYWMAATGLFLCLFLVGHLLGNLQLIFKAGEEGRRAFNEYAYFMAHNPLIKVMSWITYISILFHAIDGILLTIENKKARPVNYAYSNPKANSRWESRNMALLGSLVLIFIASHMAHFWYKAKVKSDMKLHTVSVTAPGSNQAHPMSGQPITDQFRTTYVLTTKGNYELVSTFYIKEGKYIDMNSGSFATDSLSAAPFSVKDYTKLVNKNDLQVAEGYKDLHSVVVAFFTGKKTNGVEGNSLAIAAVIFYVISMIVLSYHLLHGFASAFQSLGLRHPKYTNLIAIAGKVFAFVIPFAFAIIPVLLYINR
jgi:succinate dehydrogenase / fumarate reductase cytochrome b subunit